MTKRREFPVKVRKAALKRSGYVCEAEGAIYGLLDGKRCITALAYGVRYDHYQADGLGGAPKLENCRAVCPKCHDWKTAHVDVPAMAKADAMHAEQFKLKAAPKSKIPSPPKRSKPKREQLPLPARQPMFEPKDAR